jgi:regulatory protein
MFKKPKPLKDPSSVDHGYEYAVFLLSLRMRTEGEVRAKMKKRGYQPEAIEGVIKILYEHEYLDDRKFAEVFLDNLKRFKYYGHQMIKQKMFQKKLDKNLIEEVLTEQLGLEDELAIARRFLEKEFPSYLADKAKFSYQDKQKIAHRLQARGFRGQVIAQVIKF